MTTTADRTGPAAAARSTSTRPLGRVLVTGAASGLGRAVATAVAAGGGRPLLLDRVQPTTAETQGSGALAAVVDLADTRAAERAVVELADAAGGLDAVVTAAGTDSCGRLEDVPGEEWERVVTVNLFGTAAVVRAALPRLRATRGRVVTVASTLATRALPEASAYCASKFGVLGFSRALAAELAGEVGLTTLLPGGMDTAFFDGRTEQYKPGPDAMLNDPAAVAEAVVFALSRPAGCEVRELVVCPAVEPSWP
ncbi:SDR family oxidoreductase [Pseudonocardia dioxanivorans]|uniref:SDR family oxidoreductase n=1 Tax=Pseudonocardia dioxanivorans TaxID=240495 RepID=UPI000CD2257A|nr:SDR family oxidoreductase [Pseudonocardia dioxanivorans]